MNPESERPRTSSRASRPYYFGTEPGQEQAGEVAVGEFVTWPRLHIEREGAVDALVFFPVAGVGARQ